MGNTTSDTENNGNKKNSTERTRLHNTRSKLRTLHEKNSTFGVFRGPHFSVIGFFTEYIFVFSPNTGKYGSKEPPNTDTIRVANRFEFTLVRPIFLADV